jgi:hypothetical protein
MPASVGRASHSLLRRAAQLREPSLDLATRLADRFREVVVSPIKVRHNAVARVKQCLELLNVVLHYFSSFQRIRPRKLRRVTGVGSAERALTALECAFDASRGFLATGQCSRRGCSVTSTRPGRPLAPARARHSAVLAVYASLRPTTRRTPPPQRMSLSRGITPAGAQEHEQSDR